MADRLVDGWPFGTGEMAGRIRAFDWSTTPLGSIDRWSERLKLIVEQVLVSPLVSSLVCGAERVLVYNDAAATLYGDRHPAALGCRLPETFPEGWETVAPLYERAFAGEAVQVTGQRLDTRGESDAADVFDALLTPVRENDGRIAYVHMTGAEVGDHVRAEAARRENENRNRLLIESWAQAVWETDASGVVIADSPSWRAYTGQILEEWLGYGWLDAIHPDDRAYAERQWREAITARGLVNAEFRLRAPDGGWRWTNVRAAPSLDANGRIEKWLALNIDIDKRTRAEAALRENEERQGFLLALSDALRSLADAAAIQDIVCRMLGEKLGADRAYYVDIDEAAGAARVERDWVRPPTSSIAGTYAITDFSWSVDILRHGECHVVPDTGNAPTLSEPDRAALAALDIASCMGAPLIKDGRLVGALCVTVSRPIAWRPADVDLLVEVGERIWAAVIRARSEAALRAAEAMQRALIEGVPQLVWRGYDGGRWTWASPQWTSYTGQPEPESHNLGWLDVVHPDDREGVLAIWTGAVERGEFHADYRVRHAASGTYHWFQTRATPVRDEAGAVVEWLGTSTDVDDLRTLQDRQDVMMAELQHRTRNLIAVVRGIADDTMEHTGPTEGFRDAFFDRLTALSRVQGLLSRSEAEPITIGALVRLELDALGAGPLGRRTTITGPDVFLRPSTVQTLALALHELATNARKYGALSHEDGRLLVTWRERDEGGERRLALDWAETGREQAPERPASARVSGGYGRELIEHALPHVTGARTRYALTPSGVHCTIDIKVRSGFRSEP